MTEYTEAKWKPSKHGRMFKIQIIINLYGLDKISREDLALCVLPLAEAGKSEKWKLAIEKWHGYLVNETIDLDWAMCQGVYNAMGAA